MPPRATTRPVRVEGLRELHRAFRVASDVLTKELKDGLRDAAEPVRSDAQSGASTRIRNIGPDWSRFRIGVTTTSVYVAPAQRSTRTRRKRKNLAGLLLGEAMLPALERNIGEVEERVEDVLGTVARAWEVA